MAKQGISVEVDKNNLLDIQKMFQQLPKQVDENKIWVKFWRENSKPLVKAARNNANALGGSGQLAKSVGFFTTKSSRKYNGGYVGPKVKGAFRSKKKSGFYGAWVEYGSGVKFGGKGFGKDQTWMRDAWDSANTIVLSKGMKSAEKIFERALNIHARKLKKYGRLGI